MWHGPVPVRALVLSCVAVVLADVVVVVDGRCHGRDRGRSRGRRGVPPMACAA